MDDEVAPTIERINQATTRRALYRIVVDYYTRNGISKISYHGFYSDGVPRDIATVGFPEEWIEHYLKDHLERVDPIPMISANRVAPFRWSEAQKLSTLSDEMVEYLLEMRLAGIGDGLALTVFGPNLRNAYVSLGFAEDDFDPSPETIMAFQWVAQAGHMRFCQISDKAANLNRTLSAREREVLGLVAAGKSNTVIAQVLDISTHTVDAHVRSIYSKFGVNDRTSAALVGVQRGDLHYPFRR